MKNLSFPLAVCMFCAALMLSCGGDDTATLKINIELPQGVSALPAHDGFIDRVLGFFVAPAYAQTAPEDVEAIGITVTGPNMVPFDKTFPADTTVVTLAVNAGKKRRIAVRGIDNTGRPKYIGSRVVNLEAGSMRTVQIDMGENLHKIELDALSTAGSDPSGFVLFKKKIYFSGYIDAAGRELWAYNLDTDTASQVHDINQTVVLQDQTDSSSPTQLTVFNGKLYFSATDDGSVYNLWSYDGATDPVKVSTFTMTYGQPLEELTVVGDRLIFSAHAGGSTQTTAYYYTEADGVVEMQYEGASLHNEGYEFGFTAFGDAVCFGAYDGTNVGDCELFVYIFELGNAVKYDVYQNELPDVFASHPHEFKVFDGSLIFAAEDSMYGVDARRLYDNDGTWTIEVFNIYEEDSSPTEFTVVGGRVYFNAYNGSYNELFVYDESLAAPPFENVVMSVADVLDYGGDSVLNDVTDPHDLLGIGPVLFFTASDPTNGYSLWMHNALTLTTVRLFNIDSGESNIMETMRAGANLAFISPVDQRYLWVYSPLSEVVNEGAGQNPYMLGDGTAPSYVSNVFAVGNRLFFNAQDTNGENELWTFEIY